MFGVDHKVCQSTDAIPKISPRDQQVRRMGKVDSRTGRRCGELIDQGFNSSHGTRVDQMGVTLTVGEGGRLEASPHCEELEDFVVFM